MSEARYMRAGHTPAISWSVLLVLCLTVMAIPATLHAQTHDSAIFHDADALMAQALEMHADVLAQESFGEADRYYRRAEVSYERGKDKQDIMQDLTKAMENLTHAIETARLVRTELPDMLAAREDARSADAPTYAPELWGDANRMAEDAAAAVESRKIDRARQKGESATALFRDAELEAIKAGLFNDTEALLKRAADERIERLAPATIARAHSLLEEAAAALEADRYDTDLPRTLANDALYEAHHAYRIADIARSVDRRESTVEDIVLDAEKPLIEIAGVLDLVSRFDAGYGDVTAAVIDRIEDLSTDRAALSQDLSECRGLRDELELRLGELEEELGGVSEERQAMERRLVAEERVRERFQQVEGMFSRDEARVLREGDRIIIRLVGMQFDSGSDVIQPQYFGLLTRVQDAIAVPLKRQAQIVGIVRLVAPSRRLPRTGCCRGEKPLLLSFEVLSRDNPRVRHGDSSLPASASNTPASRILPAATTGSEAARKASSGDPAAADPGKAAWIRSIAMARSSASSHTTTLSTCGCKTAAISSTGLSSRHENTRL